MVLPRRGDFFFLPGTGPHVPFRLNRGLLLLLVLLRDCMLRMQERRYRPGHLKKKSVPKYIYYMKSIYTGLLRI
jgi:hypothetical protein